MIKSISCLSQSYQENCWAGTTSMRLSEQEVINNLDFVLQQLNLYFECIIIN